MYQIHSKIHRVKKPTVTVKSKDCVLDYQLWWISLVQWDSKFAQSTCVSQNFSSVMDMVAHHSNTPLVLIDGLERGAGPQRQCCLMHPAGFWPTEQSYL